MKRGMRNSNSGERQKRRVTSAILPLILAMLQTPFVLAVSPLSGDRPQEGKTSPSQITVDFSSPQQPPSPQQSKTLTVDDVIKLSKAGLSDDVIIAQINKRPQPFDLNADQLLQLKAANVSDRVIAAMVGSKSSSEPSSTSPPPAATATANPGTANPVINQQHSPIPADIQSLPDGFYYRTEQGWQPLQVISMAGGGLKHVGKMFVPGLTPQMVWTFRGNQAPVQIEGKRPTFCIKESAYLANVQGRTERDLLIVRFDKKSDHRELQTTNGGNVFTFKSGLSKDRMPEINTRSLAEGIFLVAPSEDLKTGEYLLTFSALGTSGYDFGIKQ